MDRELFIAKLLEFGIKQNIDAKSLIDEFIIPRYKRQYLGPDGKIRKSTPRRTPEQLLISKERHRERQRQYQSKKRQERDRLRALENTYTIQS